MSLAAAEHAAAGPPAASPGHTRTPAPLTNARPFLAARASAVLLAASSAAWTLTSLRDEFGDVLAGADDHDGLLGSLAIAGLGAGDVAGAALWGVALWYASPLQLLLVFFGVFEAERPSDWIMGRVARAAGLP